ncbi:MAG: hypothetical protein JNK79_00465 [Chitinophagaceae bacterium]|nr:hypothetical protein [Chitinophagaceae bacterium]
MEQQQIQADLAILNSQMQNLKEEMDKAISNGKSFIEVKMIHLQVKELSRLIDMLRVSNENADTRGVFS